MKENLLISVFFLTLLFKLHAETVSVTDNGAHGDALHFRVNTASNSPVVTILSTNRSSRADLGKVVVIFGCGASTLSTNNQDYLGKVVGIPDERHLQLAPMPRKTQTNASGIYGTDNSGAFQRCVDRAYGSNTVIHVPLGNYLMIPKDLMDPDYQMKGDTESRAAVMINKGGITFRGEDAKSTILTACGAWQIKGQFVSRGQLFECRGPIKNDAPLIFENLTMDGGVDQGRQDYRGFPARSSDGSGWDMTHDAVMDGGASPLHLFKAFRKCIFQHWRGEILKGVSGATNGFIEVTGCDFHDGNASAFNFDVAHHIDHCTFEHLDMAMEFYEGRMDRPSLFENSSVTDVRNNLVIVGAQKDHEAPLYTIRNNRFLSGTDFGVLIGPAKNLLIESNTFAGMNWAIGTGAGYQGTDCNRDIRIENNRCSNIHFLFLDGAGIPNWVRDVRICGNRMNGSESFAGGYGYASNVVIADNDGSQGIDCSRITGEWFKDDLSNRFPPHEVKNWNGVTNIISYEYGARQVAIPTKTNSIFLIDDSKPERIPAGAKMEISLRGSNAVKLYLTSSHAQEPRFILKPGFPITCSWISGKWIPDFKGSEKN